MSTLWHSDVVLGLRGVVILFVAALACGDDDGKAREKATPAATKTVGEMVDAGVAKRPAPPDAGRRIDIEIPVLE